MWVLHALTLAEEAAPTTSAKQTNHGDVSSVLNVGACVIARRRPFNSSEFSISVFTSNNLLRKAQYIKFGG